MLYGISFFSLSKVKIGIFLFFVLSYFSLAYKNVLENEFVDWSPPEYFILSLIFIIIVSYVFAAFLEYFYYKVRRKWPRWF
ncbi:MAG: hypothetical protein COX63_03000 [Candidatus Diapherotrites archaeon CG_4_10_14_0_2_um_filter_31_5]|nr:MAG: hypothetical protein COX63_03000 [Candidatus Diapherotrites archaeon CG_4_10_14_0_2_um_filter_31_5]